MTTRNFDALFSPGSVALVGASNRAGSVGGVLARNLLGGGFRGPVMTVNPHETAIRSTLNYRSVAELPLAPDLAVIATPPPTVPGVVAELAGRGCRAAVVVTAGFGEGGAEAGARLKQAMLDAARPHLMRIVGPNCLGVLQPGLGLNASFAHLQPAPGNVAFVTQSGAIATTVIDWAAGRGLGFSYIVTLGDMADVDFGDVLDFLAQDRGTRAILMYVEQITAARKFMSAARIAARAKPVIVVKAGRSEAGARAAASHTGALAGADGVYGAAFRRAGVLRVYGLRELFEAAQTLATGVRVHGDRLTVVTNGGGLGVMTADALEARRGGGRLSELDPATVAALSAVLPAAWSHGNPIDILGDADGERYGKALEIAGGLPGAQAMLVINCPTGVADSFAAAQQVVALKKRRSGLPLLTAWVGEATVQPARALFRGSDIPTYDAPDEAVQAFTHLVNYRRNQQLLLETPPARTAVPEPSRAAARTLVKGVLASGRRLLTGPESKRLLALYGVPVAETLVAAGPAEVKARAAEIAAPAAVKILSPDITHKSDVGGVALDLATPEAAEAAALAMLERVRAAAPQARIEGFTVERMIHRPYAAELIVGVASDRTFGPVLLFGQGGVAVEAIADRAMGLPPLNRVLAREMIERTRVVRLLRGYRDRPPADLDAVADLLVRLSDMLIDLENLTELDINPLLADADGVIALDARVVIKPAGERGAMSIRPYPSELETEVALRTGERLAVRPIRPEDEGALVKLAERMDPEDVRLRFLGPMRSFPHEFAARMSQIDYDREMALVALEPSGPIAGVVRLIAEPDHQRAEYAVLVRSDLKGAGLGYALMRLMLADARRQGLSEVFGEVLAENEPMLNLARALGARTHMAEHGVVHVTFALT